MFFFTRLKKEFSPVSAISKAAFNCLATAFFVCTSLNMLSAESLPKEPEPATSWSAFIPLAWQENIMVPSLQTSMSIISISPAASGISGNSDVTVQIKVKNDGMETLNCIQIAFDIKNQIGVPPFVGLTGSLSALTGSGMVFGGPPITGSMSLVYGGTLNTNFDGMMSDTLFNALPTLQPDQCIAINIPFEITDTSGIAPIVVDAISTGKTSVGDPVSSTSAPLQIVRGCESVSLACAGKVNVTLGPDCMAIIGLSTVFLNNVPDTNRFEVAVFHNGVNLGNKLFEEHVGKPLTYSVYDRCFNNRASCWGTIVLENKNIPSRSSTYQEIFCGEDPDPIGSLDDIIDSIYADCFVNITSFSEFYDTSGDKCGGSITIRGVIGEYTIDGWKARDTIHIDTIVELPLDIDALDPPLGGPDKPNAITVNCDSLGGLYPTPGFIEDYYNNLPATTGSGTAYAYPHINQGVILMEMYESRDTIIQIAKDTTLLIDSVWVNVRVILKDTLTVTDTFFITKPDLVAIKTGTTCNLTVNYADSYFAGCAGDESKIMRSWKILNWCTGELGTFNQWILIDDDRGPDIVMEDTAYVLVAPWTCLSEYPLSAEVSDNCSEVRSLNWKASAGMIGEDNVLRGITLEDNPVKVELQAIDECGNDSTKVLYIFVLDSIPPVAIAKDELNATLTYDPVNDRSFAKVTVASVDQGSHDSGCGPVDLCLLLDEELANPIVDEFGSPVQDSLGNILYHAVQCEIDGFYKGQPYVICKEAVKFCCDQVGQHRVALIANDRSDLSPPGYSWTLVNVEDKSFPFVQCEELTVECGTSISPDSIGYPGVSEGLCDNAILEYFDIEDLNDCGLGKIYRNWVVNGDTSCTQVINIEGTTAFDPRGIKWPKHYNDESVTGIIRECTNDTMFHWEGTIEMGSSFVCSGDVLAEPVWCPSSCSMLFMTFEDQEAEAGEACRKIIRTWTVIDWCTYRPNTNETNDDSDTFEAVSDEMITTPHIKSDLNNGDLCLTCDKPSSLEDQDIFFRYKEVDVDGFYNFEQIIKIIDDTPPVVDAPEEVEVLISSGARFKGDDRDDCIGKTDVVAYAVELCGDILLDAGSVRWLVEVFNEDGEVIDTKSFLGDSAIVNSQYGIAGTEHTINWYVTDGCGNEGFGSTIVKFIDVFEPSPLCISELSTATMDVENGSVTIWASDYDHGSYDNCSDIKTFFRTAEGVATSSLTFSCDDIPDGQSAIKQLLLYVSDEAGNESSCNVSIRIDDNNNVCPDSLVGQAQIAGQFMTEGGDMIEAANVILNNDANTVTNVQGAYAFSFLPMASSYKIEGLKNDDPLNGVSTLDLVLIQRHILALDRFDSPYKVIAADINADRRVSAVDLVQLRRLILGYTEDFPNNSSWRFVDPAQKFASIDKPWPFTEQLIVYDLSQDMTDQNLLGIKTGDVSGNAIANSLLSKSRSTRSLSLSVDDQTVSKGEVITVPVRIMHKQQLSGLQFTMDAYKGKIKGILSGSLTISNAEYAVHNEKTLTVAWSNQEPVTASDILFSVIIEADANQSLSSMLSISDRITAAEAYGTSYDPITLDLEYNNEAITSFAVPDFQLMQNEPNPFNNATKIGFTLPEQATSTLTFMDLTGKVLYRTSQVYPSGYNEITVTKDDLPGRGVIYYKLEVDGFTQTRKMILIE